MTRKLYDDIIVINIAKKCKSYTDFCNKHRGAYSHARKNKIIDKIKRILPSAVKPNGYWENIKNCIKAAKNCNSKIEFRNTFRTAYETVKRNNWDNDVFTNFVDPRIGRTPHNFRWGKKDIYREAIKYKRRGEFEKKAPGAYKTASGNGYLDDVCKHMESVGHAYKRAVYAIEFSDKSVYIGITFDYHERYRQHIKNKSSNHRVEKRKKTKKHKWVEFGKWFDLEKAQEEEMRIIKKYINNGWEVLNLAKTGKGSGSLGSSRLIWTDDKIAECALLCNTPNEFKKRFPSAYRRLIMQKKELIPVIYEHMSQGKKPKGYWIRKVNCKKAAAKFKKRSHFSKKYPRAYHVSRKNDWLKEFFQ